MADRNNKKSGGGGKNKKDGNSANNEDGSDRIDSLLDAGSGSTTV